MKLFKYLLVFGAGAGVGALVANAILKRKYEELAMEEIEFVRAYAKKRIDEVEKHLEDLDSIYTPTIDEYKGNGDDVVNDLPKKQKIIPAREKVDYTKCFTGAQNNTELDDVDPAEEESPEDDDEETEAEIDSNTRKEKQHLPPYIITQDDFMDECKHYDKITFTYYDEDGVLADEREEIVSNQDYLIGGEDNLNFGVGSGDADIVYIRNEAVQSDFEVICVHDSYSRSILGISEVDD